MSLIPSQTPNTLVHDAIVIGAGQAGLAAGYHLQQAGQRFVILDAGDRPGGSWQHYYRSLKLFSPARFSSLPGMAFPGDPGHYPSRDATIDYLARYASEFHLPILNGQRVANVTRRADGVFEVHTGGQPFLARNVITASGSFERPRVPVVAGQAHFRGQVLHSLAYNSPDGFAGKRVVVVGAANSGVQIATELSAVARVTIAARRPPSLIRQHLLGADVHFWWWLFGLDTAETHARRAAIFKRLHSKTGPAVLDPGAYGKALAAGIPDVRPMFSALTPEGVVWADGTSERVDAVVYATGFTANLDYLQALGALDGHGQARQRKGINTGVPGLYHVGLSYQRTYASATLRGVGPDAAVVVDHLQERAARAQQDGPASLGLIVAVDNQAGRA